MLDGRAAGLRRRDPRHGRGQQGQVLVLFVAFFSIALMMGAYAIDQGLFLGQRRVSQKDADQAALAGALQLVTDQDPGRARSAAAAMVAANEPADKAEIVPTPVVDGSCFSVGGRLDAVSVAVKFETSGLFLRSLGVDAPNTIGARAKACVGVAQAPPSVVPFVISTANDTCFNSDDTPKFNQQCKIRIRNKDGTSPSILNLNLKASNDSCSEKGSGNITRQVADGARGACLISTNAGCSGSQWNDCVAVRNGNADDVLQGLQTRLARPDNCGGTAFGGAAYLIPGSGPDPLYQPADCDPAAPGVQISPRLVTLAVLARNPPSGNPPQRISAFAAFHIDGCESNKENGKGNDCNGRDCNGHDCEGKDCDDDNECEPVLFGHLLKLVLAGHAAGPANNATTVFSVSLGD